MSVERFFDEHPPDQFLRVTVEARRGVSVDKPLIVFFAEKLIDAASERIREADRELSERDDQDSNVRQAEQGSSKELVEMTRDEFGAVFFGATMIGISEMLEDGLFDNYTFVSRVDNAFSGSRFTTVKDIFGTEPYVLTEEKKKEVRRAAEKDPTLTFFFEDPYALLPPKVYDVLLKTKYIWAFKETKLLARWKERVELLVDKPEEPQVFNVVRDILAGLDWSEE